MLFGQMRAQAPLRKHARHFRRKVPLSRTIGEVMYKVGVQRAYAVDNIGDNYKQGFETLLYVTEETAHNTS